MDDLLKKLNTLIKANLNDLLSPAQKEGRVRSGSDSTPRNMDREVAALRQQINRAVDQEERLKARVQTLLAEIERYDRQADELVKRGEEEDARFAIMQMKLKQQHLTQAESDLREHQLVTEELIQKVNMLEALVAQARAQQHAEAPAPASADASTSDAEPANPQSESVAGRILKDTRETIDRMGELLNKMVTGGQGEPSDTSQPAAAAQTAAAPETPPDSGIDDDLARRLQRLSKPTATHGDENTQ